MGPLTGITVLEIGGIGPGPFCAMMLADMGATVVRIDRKDQNISFVEAKYDILHRGKKKICMDLKKKESIAAILKMAAKVDVLLEGFRPGVMERLGIGPDECLKQNPRLVYCRMTGWGQSGPLSKSAGHDINYISLVGALNCIGHKGMNPPPPLNLIGDQGGGGMLAAFGIVCALMSAEKTGRGQMVDAAIIDGVAAMMAGYYGALAAGQWSGCRQDNILDGGAHFYNTYETKDEKFISVGAWEPQFYGLFLARTGLSDDKDFADQKNQHTWDLCRQKLSAVFKTRTQKQWCDLMEGTDICFAPVNDFDAALKHPHNKARGVFVEIDGIPQPAPAPRFSLTQPATPTPPRQLGADTFDVLTFFGFSQQDMNILENEGVI